MNDAPVGSSPEVPESLPAPSLPSKPVANGDIPESPVPSVEVRLITESDEEKKEPIAEDQNQNDRVEITLHTETPPSPPTDDVKQVKSKEDSELFMANVSRLRSLCKRGDAEELDKFLTEVNPDDIDLNIATEDGWTCLHDMITHECQFTQVAKVLINHGAEVNTRDINGDSPLHSALLYHNTDNIRLLLEGHSDLEAVNLTGRRPIHIANDSESLQLLLDFGAELEAPDRVGNTALHFAVMAKDRERVELLLQKGCNVHLRNRAGSTPLHLATSDAAIAQLLLNSQANTNCVDNAGNSPMHIAVRGRHREVARLLLTNNADAHLTNNHGKSPLNLAKLKDKEMRNILLGKDTPVTPVNGVSKKPKKVPVTIPFVKDLITPPIPVIVSPSILKRKKMQDDRPPTGPKLRFSEVNDYSGVEDNAPPSKRVKVPPIYTDPQFSSGGDWMQF